MRSLLFCLSVLLASCRADDPDVSPCRVIAFEGDQFTACDFDSRKQSLRLALRSADGSAYRSFQALARDLAQDEVEFAMNAGMFDASGDPVGLYVENGQELKSINTRAGLGNFHMAPNGVFWADSSGAPHVSETAAYLGSRPKPVWATQSGPMLVIAGQLHPDIQHDGPSLYIRNGVGVSGEHSAVFVISDQPVSFGKLARLFRDVLHCPDALYLDGAVSGLWAPSLKRMDRSSALGPLIVTLPR